MNGPTITDSDYDMDSISFFMLVNGTHPDTKGPSKDSNEDLDDEDSD